jgi:glucosamine--fructose-6-phosphate aminotransferase (isomerizing)
LRTALESAGHTLISQTDSEVIAHLIGNFLSQGMPEFDAFQEMLGLLRGTYMLRRLICIARDFDPDKPRNLAKSVTVE